MSAVAEPDVLQKRQYKNQTAGWLGVVMLDGNDKEYGYSVEPYGTVWLSDAEAVCTARAPRDPKDNPFVEQMFAMQNNETGARVMAPMKPLVLVEGGSAYKPAGDRYLPPGVAGTPGDASAPDEVTVPVEAIVNPTAVPPVQVQAGKGGVAGALFDPNEEPASAEEVQSWVGEPQAPGRALPSPLGGSDEAPASAGEARDLSAPTQQATAPLPGHTISEEHAAAYDPQIGEETGAAVPPKGPAPEGEYAQAEEVGTPVLGNDPTENRT